LAPGGFKPPTTAAMHFYHRFATNIYNVWCGTSLGLNSYISFILYKLFDLMKIFRKNKKRKKINFIL